jgi:hypothetical protein
MNLHVLTLTPAGAEFTWLLGGSTLADILSAAIEFAGPGSHVVRWWREGEWV